MSRTGRGRTPGRWRKLWLLLDELVATPPEARSRRLAESTRGDPELSRELEALVAAHEQTGILDLPPEQVAAELLASSDGDASSLDASDPVVGSQVGPFQVLRHLGAGGMGDVYEASDPRLGRRVALKLLPPWLRGQGARDRFAREARAASALDHPNICTLHDIGETEDGRLYLVMAYYPGRALDRLLENGPLEVDRAVGIALQVARGLHRAHQAGIVHRDIKPSNVIVDDRDQVKILDFGIAHIAGETALTAPESRPGTPAYMAPEQAQGEEIDARVDIWAFGVLLYEMLTGKRPFAAASAEATIHGILHREPTPATELRPDLPPELLALLERTLRKDPGERPSSLDEVMSALGEQPPGTGADAGPGTSKRPSGTGPRESDGLGQHEGGRRNQRIAFRAIAAGALVLVVLAVAIFLGLRRDRTGEQDASGETTSPPAEPAVPALAILPFVDRSGPPGLPEWAGAGTARLVSGALASSRYLRVVSPEWQPGTGNENQGNIETSARRFAQDEDIDYLVTGEILPGTSGGLLLAARLQSVASGEELGSVSRPAADLSTLLAVSSQVAREFRTALRLPLHESVDVYAADSASESPEAYGHYLQGLRAFADFRYEKAEPEFRQALELAPGYTMARYRLAYSLAASGRTSEATPEIQRVLQEARRLPDREQRYIRAGAAYIDRRFEDAIAAYEELVELFPYETEARSLLAVTLGGLDRNYKKLAHLQVLARLAPEDPTVWSQLGFAYLDLGKHAQAVDNFRRYLELRPGSANGHHSLGEAFRSQGHLHQAAREFEKALSLEAGFAQAAVDLAVVDALRGRWAAAEERLRGVVTNNSLIPRYRIDAAFELVLVLRSQGRFREAVAMLQSLAPEIEAEGTREAWSLALQGDCLRRLGELKPAEALISRAIEVSPGVATRYLFARGLLELDRGHFDQISATAERILAGALPADNPDRTEEKGAAYLLAMAELQKGEAGAAVPDLLRATTSEGYRYRLYGLDLARAYLALNRAPDALAAYQDAVGAADPSEPRLDLELDRVLGLRLLAAIHRALQDPASAEASAQQFRERWALADTALSEPAEAP